ncbi:MAG: helix-turn-helix domain-containing protein [Methylobacter sp.]
MNTKVNEGGRPTSFKSEYIELAFNYCLLGATDEQLADFFNVAKSTINLWKQKQPKFLDALKRGKTQADANVAHSLYKRATGYSHPDVHISNYQSEITKTEITKHYPPDTTACIFWLKNRQPKLWKDRVEVKEESVVRIIPWDELREISKKALEFADAEHERLIVGRAERLGIKIEYGNEED